MSNDPEAVATYLRMVLEDTGLDAARQSFAKRAAAWSIEERTRLAHLVFGPDHIEAVRDLIIGDNFSGDKHQGSAEARDHARIYGPQCRRQPGHDYLWASAR